MILYHSSNCIVDKIDLNKCRSFKDFGKGFYTRELEDQAWNMAKRTGAVANDDIRVTLELYIDGRLTSEALLESLRYKNLSQQISFHSLNAINFLTKRV